MSNKRCFFSLLNDLMPYFAVGAVAAASVVPVSSVATG